MDTSNGMIVTGASVAWCGLIAQGKGTAFKVNNLAGDPAGSKFIFDALVDASYKPLLPAEQSSDSKIEKTIINGAKIQFKKREPIINGETGVVESGGSSASDIIKGEISITTASKDVASASWSAFIAKVMANMGKYWFVCIPTGYTSAQLESSTPNADGFVMLIGRLSSDLDIKISPNEVQTVTLSFKSESVAAYETTGSTEQMTDEEADTFFALDTNFLLPTLTDYALDIEVNPPDIGATDGHILVKGGLLVKSVA